MTQESAASALNIIERLFIELVEYPQCLTTTIEDSHGAIKILVATSYLPDHKRLVGRKGQSYYAMQTLVEAMGSKSGQRLLLPRYEDPSGDVGQLSAPGRRPDRNQRLEGLLNDVLTHLPVAGFRCHWLWEGNAYQCEVTVFCGVRPERALVDALDVVFVAIGRRWQCELDLRVAHDKELTTA